MNFACARWFACAATRRFAGRGSIHLTESMADVKVTLLNGQNERRDLSRDPSRVEFVAAKVEFSWGVALTHLWKLRLSDAVLQALQERCAYCFGRFAAPDDLFYSSEEWEGIERKRQASL